MHVNLQQREFRGVSRGLFQSAARLARRAHHSERRRREICAVHEYFSEQSAWRRAVEAACKVYAVDPETGLSVVRDGDRAA